jgi:integrase
VQHSNKSYTTKPIPKSDYLIVCLPISNPSGRCLPFLILGEQFCFEQIAYARKLMRTNWSPSKVQRAATVIGLFYNYWRFAHHSKHLSPEDLSRLIEYFAEARYYGTIEKDGNDKTGLRWAGCSLNTVKMDVYYISHFLEYCAIEFGYAHANPTVNHPMGYGEQLINTARRAKSDLLHYLYELTGEGQGIKRRLRFQIRDRRPSRGIDALRVFPMEKVKALILESPSIRDQNLWFLLAYSGLRISEALNLFVDDIDVDEDGAAIIYLKDPCDGIDERYDPITKTPNNVSRKVFLRARYGLLPRDVLPKNHPLHAGWKGMLWDDNRKKVSIVHWLTPSYGQLFWQLHTDYLNQVRANVPDSHPYYYVSTNRNNYGEPLKMGNARLQFARACKRMDITKGEGAGRIHTLRHFYKWASCSVGGISLVDQRRRMHHHSLASTEEYGFESAEELNRRLKQSFTRIESLMPVTKPSRA